MKPSLALNMIVKNEADRIERCLVSVLPYVKQVSILDTGSTDDTKRIIRQVCLEHGITAAIADGPFEDFSQARNAAFHFARLQAVGARHCQFALLMDADMELVVDDPTAFDGLDANALSYDMMQKGGSVAYANRRILTLDWGADPYVGVTHEYIDVEAGGMIEGAWFRDHADGANRTNKYERDAKLLEDALVTEPTNGRYWYYLGNTYRDNGQHLLAADAYKKRIELGGWDEETHSAMMNLACSYLDAGHKADFVVDMMAAYSFRPSRAEPLYDLAKYFREKGDNASALMFAKAGVNKKRPNDLLFVNEFVYSHGLRYEYSIAGYYDPEERPRAFEATNALALDPSCPEGFRNSARSNLFWHLKQLESYCPSAVSTTLDVDLPAGYTAMNPSVEVCNDLIKVNVRAVNYTINEHGQYMIGDEMCGDKAIETRNFVVSYDADWNKVTQREIIWHRPQAAWDKVIGLEDIRLWRYCGELHFSATVREQNAGGQCEMVQGRLAYDIDDKFMQVTDWKKISDGQSTEKNWMPVPSTSLTGVRYAYNLDTIVTPSPVWSATVAMTSAYVGDLRGSSQFIPFKQGYLGVVHEATVSPETGQRVYWHRFVWLDMDLQLRRIGLPFVFEAKQIEFCAGLAYHPNRQDLIISYGVRDEQARIATVNIEEVSALLWKFHE